LNEDRVIHENQPNKPGEHGETRILEKRLSKVKNQMKNYTD